MGGQMPQAMSIFRDEASRLVELKFAFIVPDGRILAHGWKIFTSNPDRHYYHMQITAEGH